MRKRTSLLTIPVLGLMSVAVPVAAAQTAEASSPAARPAYGIVDITASADYAYGAQAVAVNQAGLVVGTGLAGPFSPQGFSWTATGGLQQLGEPNAAVAVNTAGEIAGNTQRRYTTEAFVYADGTLTPIGYLHPVNMGGETGSSRATDISPAGQVVGDSYVNDQFDLHAFSWRDGTLTDLGTLGGANSTAAAVNPRGQVAGTADTAAGAQHAVLWSGGQATDLGTLGGSYSAALALNSRGQVVGISQTATGAEHAFLWDRGTMRDLGVLGGDESSRAVAINDRGQVLVGSSDSFGEPSHAFVWANGRRTPIGGLGSDVTYALAMNNCGQVVGTADTASGERHAFVARDGATIDLGTLGGPSSIAVDINNAGMVVGSADPATGSRHAVTWRPTQ